MVRRIVKGTKVTAQSNKNLELPKIIYILLIDIIFVLFIQFIWNTQVSFSNSHFSTHSISHPLLCSISHPLNLLLSVSLSLSSIYFPPLFLLASVLYKKEFDLYDQHHWINTFEQILLLTQGLLTIKIKYHFQLAHSSSLFKHNSFHF